MGALWIKKTNTSSVTRHTKAEGSLVSVWYKDVGSKIYLRLKRNYGGTPWKIAPLKTGISLFQEREGESWRDFSESLLRFVEAGVEKGKKRVLLEPMKLSHEKHASAAGKGTLPFWYKEKGKKRCDAGPSKAM